MMPDADPTTFRPCAIRQLPDYLTFFAADYAMKVAPAANAPPRPVALLSALGSQEGVITPYHLAIMVGKWWGSAGVHLTVGFLESISAAVRQKIMDCANLWSQYANIQFSYTADAIHADVRIAAQRDGFWSYLGTDIKSVPPGQATMNLEDYLVGLPDSEYLRVVPHEHFHTCGGPHEHMRWEIIDRLDPEKTIAYFSAWQGWSREMVIQQVLTPLDEASIRGTPHAEEDSIMSYPVPGQCTRDGRPIVGGTRITADDGAFAGQVYPRSDVKPPSPPDPPPPPPPPIGDLHLLILDAPPVAARVVAGQPARFRLDLPDPTEFYLSAGGNPAPVRVTGGRSGKAPTHEFSLRNGWTGVRAPAGSWEFRLAPAGNRGGQVWVRVTSFAGRAVRETEPVMMA